MASNSRRLPIMQVLRDVEDNGSLLWGEPHFYTILRLEERRTGRSGKPFLLMLLNFSSLLHRSRGEFESLKKIRKALHSCLRETDLKGWFKEDVIIGVILTEIAQIDDIVRKKIVNKVRDTISGFLGPEEAREIRISLHTFPEDLRHNRTGDEESLI